MATAAKQTRSSVCDPIFGDPKEFSGDQLPTYSDVFRHYRYIMFKNNFQSNSPRKPILKILISDLMQIWQKASIPTIQEYSIEQLLQRFLDKHANKLRSIGKDNFEDIAANYLKSNDVLFNISSCKCKDFANCTCSKEKKIPKAEREFFEDQKKDRDIYIGALDIAMTRKNIEKQNRQRTIDEGIANRGRGRPPVGRARGILPSSESLVSPGPSTSMAQIMVPEYSTPEKDLVQQNTSMITRSMTATTPRGRSRGRPRARAVGVARGSLPAEKSLMPTNPSTSTQCRIDITSVIQESDRYMVSDRATAAIASATLQSVNLVSEEETANIIDKSKIRRDRKRWHSKLRQEEKVKLMHSIYFDGRIDDTNVMVNKMGKMHPDTVPEEHIVLVEEPGSLYVTHLTPASGTANNITDSIFNFLQEDEIDTSSIQVIGCDGTNVNTGTSGGILQHIEERLGRAVHWSVCLLHLNELLLKRIFEQIDGKTTGPKTFSGPIGKQLEICQTFPILRTFRPIQSPIPQLSDEEISDLSTDQNLLYRLCKAINDGAVDDNLGNRTIGPLNHARWVTAGARVLRLYMATPKPTRGLKVITTFIVKVYAILWFKIRFKHSIEEGPKHLFEMISLSRYLCGELRSEIDKTIQRNGFFAHQENILLAMTCDENESIKELAYRRMKKGRTYEEKRMQSSKFRRFKIPEINFSANHYSDMIKWENVDPCCPPLLHYKLKEIEAFLEEKKYPSHSFEDYPCHNQAVERAVKLVTEASAKKYGFIERDGLIRSCMKSREKRKCFDSKKQFFNKQNKFCKLSL